MNTKELFLRLEKDAQIRDALARSLKLSFRAGNLLITQQQLCKKNSKELFLRQAEVAHTSDTLACSLKKSFNAEDLLLQRQAIEDAKKLFGELLESYINDAWMIFDVGNKAGFKWVLLADTLGMKIDDTYTVLVVFTGPLPRFELRLTDDTGLEFLDFSVLESTTDFGPEQRRFFSILKDTPGKLQAFWSGEGEHDTIEDVIEDLQAGPMVKSSGKT